MGEAHNRVKVAILIPCLKRGGTELQSLSLSAVLRSCSLSVQVICYFEYDELVVEDFKNAGVEVKLLNLNRESGCLRLINNLWQEIRSEKPDNVNVQYMAPGALPIIAARLAGVKTIFATVHQPYTTSHGLLAKLILRAVSILATKFISVSQNAEKSWFGASTLFDETKPLKLHPHHFTIHNSIDTDKISKIVSEVSISELKSELYIPADIPVIGAVSRLRQEKGIDILLEAFTLLVRSGERAHLLLVGSGPDEKKLEETVQTYGLTSSITLYGEADWAKAMQLMSIMDIIAIPSLFEGFGLSAVEAMAMGKPVIASDTSGLKEVVVHGETGFLFPVGNVTTLKVAIEKLIREPQLRERLGTTGKERVLKNFSLDLYNRKIKVLYNIQP
ncbi:MAG TPA: hypothetical protein DDW27_08290 [Bacteroidales bacterium]|nr:hypothetical protein [Bacteroidales bacterium]